MSRSTYGLFAEEISFPTIRNTNVSYFDYAATTFMPESVIQKWCEINTNCGVSVGRSAGTMTAKAEEFLVQSEDTFRSFFGFNNEYNFFYTKNVTESINIVALGMEDMLKPLEIIAVGPYEHHSNYLPWKRLAEKTGAIFLEIPTNEFGDMDYSFIEQYRDRIKVLTVSAISNSFGYKVDVTQISRMIKNDTVLLVDQSQVTGHEKLTNNNRIDVHFISSHKMYGPKNISLVALREDFCENLKPVLLGGGMVNSVGYKSSWNDGVKKFYSGTFDVALVCAFAEACKFISLINYNDIQQRESALFECINNKLHELDNISVIHTGNCASHIITFTHKLIHPHDLNQMLANKNIIIRSGNLCSQNAMRMMNVNAVNRISFGLGIRNMDIGNLISALKELEL